MLKTTFSSNRAKKKNEYDEIIALHGSSGSLSFESNGKVFNFERVDVNEVGTLNLTVN